MYTTIVSDRANDTSVKAGQGLARQGQLVPYVKLQWLQVTKSGSSMDIVNLKRPQSLQTFCEIT